MRQQSSPEEVPVRFYNEMIKPHIWPVSKMTEGTGGDTV